MPLGSKLAELRLRKGASLQDVADAVGVSKTHIWQLEKGSSQNPSIDLIRKLADHFNVPLTFLADEDGSTSVADVEAQQFFRDFQSLAPSEQALLKQTIEVFKNRKTQGDGSA
ncbi:helix-turn-helix transcriptional regulator [Aquabacterium sp.]|uniref:helix-turn-helix domain-containing protein n=1 Tax=Aquabacterium sp. TaxID=1872578 RepID=UPI00344B501C